MTAERRHLAPVIAEEAVAEGLPVLGIKAHNETEVLGVNDPVQLAQLERAFQARQAQALMRAGVRLAIAMYVDVSGSMLDKLDAVAGFVDALKDFPIRMRSFDTAVRDVDPARVAKGQLAGGGGTDSGGGGGTNSGGVNSNSGLSVDSSSTTTV